MTLSKTMKNVGMLTLFSLMAAGLTGCVSSPTPCSASAARDGYFCYQGLNFGRIDDPVMREGVRDGCQTGRGYFRKNYRLSGSSESYRQGWDKGRALCRPANWSDSPTYSYHPLPGNSTQQPAAQRESDEETYVTAEERIRRYNQ